MEDLFNHIKELQECSRKCDELCNDMFFENITREEITAINHYVRNYFMCIERNILKEESCKTINLIPIHQSVKLLDNEEKKQIADNLVTLLKKTYDPIEGIRMIHSTILSIVI